MQSEFSDSSRFQSEELEYQLKPIDLTRAFNRDVVHSPGDDSEDPFQPVTKQLLIDGYRPDDSSKEQFNGVPRDGIIGPHQLGDYQKPNSIQLDSKNDQADIVLPPAHFSSLRFLTGAFLHGHKRHEDALKVTLSYADGTQQECRVQCPDWGLKTDHQNPNSELLPANIVRHGMDLGSISGGPRRANLALFDALIPVDSSRKLTSITLLADDEGPLNPGARINILAITGVALK